MILFQFGEHPLHKGFAEKGGAVLDLETAAVLLYGSHFLVVETNDLPVPPDKGGFLPVEEIGIYRRTLSFALFTQNGR